MTGTLIIAAIPTEERSAHGKPFYGVVLINASEHAATLEWTYRSYIDMPSGLEPASDTGEVRVTEVEAGTWAPMLQQCTGMSDLCGFYEGRLAHAETVKDVHAMLWMDASYQELVSIPVIGRPGWTAEEPLLP